MLFGRRWEASFPVDVPAVEYDPNGYVQTVRFTHLPGKNTSPISLAMAAIAQSAVLSAEKIGHDAYLCRTRGRMGPKTKGESNRDSTDDLRNELF